MSITEGAYSCILRLVCGFGYNLESNGNSSIVIVDSRDLDCGGPCFFVIAVSDFIVRTGSQLLLTKSDCCFWFDRGSGVGIAFLNSGYFCSRNVAGIAKTILFGVSNGIRIVRRINGCIVYVITAVPVETNPYNILSDGVHTGWNDHFVQIPTVGKGLFADLLYTLFNFYFLQIWKTDESFV